MLPHPPTSPLFPYTTLFRSHQTVARRLRGHQLLRDRVRPDEPEPSEVAVDAFLSVLYRTRSRRSRSEEHTSELQSPMYLVCRLLLEKKKPRSQLRIALDQ